MKNLIIIHVSFITREYLIHSIKRRGAKKWLKKLQLTASEESAVTH